VALSLLASSGGSAAPPSFDDLLAELSNAIVSALAAGEPVQVTAANPDQAHVARALAATLAQRGVQVVDGQARAVITFVCTITVRERLCAAEIKRDEAIHIVSARGSVEGAATPLTIAPMVLELRPLVGQHTPVLDVALLDSRMLVLDPSAVVRYDRTERGWQMRETKPIVLSRTSPRDVRGRIVATPTSFDAYLPGATCRGTVEPFAVSCVEQQAPWPVGFENQGMVPARNYFTSASGMFYAMAPLDADAGAKWLAATRDGTLVLLDAAGAALTPPLAAGDEVARLNNACAAGSHVLVPTAGVDAAIDGIRLFRVADRRLEAATPPAMLPGTLTAMWPAADATSAIVVSHNPTTGGYEAFQVRVSCGR
jgi:hypothetical protein